MLIKNAKNIKRLFILDNQLYHFDKINSNAYQSKNEITNCELHFCYHDLENYQNRKRDITADEEDNGTY